MDTNRESLKLNSTIILTAYQESEGSHSEQRVEFTIEKVIGYGASTIVYLAKYFSGGIRQRCILKELYPRRLYHEKYDIRREGVRLLQPWERDLQLEDVERESMQAEFAKKQQHFRNSFQTHVDLFHMDDEDNVLNHLSSEPRGFYEGNGTFYAAFAYRKGESYADYHDEQNHPKEADLTAILEIGKAIAECVRAYHKQGYLHLDIREDNVFLQVGGGAQHGVLLIDIDSLRESSYFKTLQVGQKAEDVYYNGNAPLPPEIQYHEYNRIDESTDVFMLAALLYRRITGQDYDMPFLEELVELHDSAYVRNNPVVAEQLQSFFYRALSDDGRNGTDRPIRTMDAMMRELDELLLLVQKEFAFEDDNPKRYQMELEAMQKKLQRYSDAMFSILEKEGQRFHALKKFWYFENHLRLSDGGESLTRTEEVEQVFAKRQHIFLYGDGGMGKSTALYERWKNQVTHPENGQYCFYIELHDLYRGRQGHEWTGSHAGDVILQYIADQMHDIYGSREQQGDLDLMQALFKKQSVKPEYTLLLDGLNEMTENDRNVFMQVLDYCVTNWTNVRMIMTGRKIDRNLPKAFARYALLGLDDDRKREKLASSGKYTTAEIDKMQQENKPLWQILSIPLFMNLFVDIRMNTKIRTRGEILDAFVYSKAGSLDHTMNRPEDVAFRKFVMRYMVPFLANQMDRDHVNDISEEACEESIERCKALYLMDYDLPTSYWTERYDRKLVLQKWDACSEDRIDYDEEGNYRNHKHFDVSVILKLLQESVCYFVRTYDNSYEFVHSYFREYFAAKHILNVLEAAEHIGRKKHETAEQHRARQRRFIKRNQLCYAWSQEACAMLGDMTHDYRNAPQETVPEKRRVKTQQDALLAEGQHIRPETETP